MVYNHNVKIVVMTIEKYIILKIVKWKKNYLENSDKFIARNKICFKNKCNTVVRVLAEVVGGGGGGGRPSCIMMGYSEPTGAESREGSPP